MTLWAVLADTFTLRDNSFFGWLVASLFVFALVAGFGWCVLYLVFSFRRGPSPAASTGGEQESAEQLKRKHGERVGMALLLLPISVAMFYFTVWREGPMAVRVENNLIQLVYRLPWQNTSIHLSEINRVELFWRSRSRRGLGTNWPVVTIDYDSATIEIMAENGDYEPAVVDMYERIASLVPDKATSRPLRE